MSLGDHFAAMKKVAEKPKAVETVRPAGQPDIRTVEQAAIRPAGKRSDPEFEAVMVYLRKRTHKLARRKCEDEGNGDFSELMERLAAEYLDS